MFVTAGGQRPLKIALKNCPHREHFFWPVAIYMPYIRLAKCFSLIFLKFLIVVKIIDYYLTVLSL